MIGYLKGTLLNIKDSTCIIYTSCGVGYQVLIPLQTLKKLSKNKEVELYIKTIVKDNDIELYGFLTKEEKDTFEMLLKINQLGPKIALNIISLYSLKELESIVIKGDWKALTHVPGIGPKLAKRILLELKENILKPVSESYFSKDPVYCAALSALVNLGYKEEEVKTLLESVMKEKKDISEKELIKETLKRISKELPL